MSKILSGRGSKAAAATALAVAVSLAAAAPAFAASHHNNIKNATPAQTYYDVAPAQSVYSAGQVGLRTNPAVVAPGAFGPPDPASCGGFHC